MQLLEDDIEVMLREDGLDDALQYDDDQPLVESVVLQHVEQHAQAGPTRLTPWNQSSPLHRSRFIWRQRFKAIKKQLKAPNAPQLGDIPCLHCVVMA